MFEPLTVRRNPAEFSVDLDDESVTLEDGDSTIVYRNGRLNFSTDVQPKVSFAKPTTYSADFIDGHLVSSTRPIRLFTYYVDKTGVIPPEVHKRFPPMLTRFKERVAKSPDALRMMGLADYMKLSARENPVLSGMPSWALWAAGGAAGAIVLLMATNASAAPYPSVRTSIPYRDEYDSLFSTCVVNPSRLAEVDRIIERIKANRSRYEQVQNATQVPWWFIAAVHNLEGSMSFTTHLHNGDPLSARTVHVPAGRPVAGSPPFTWEESALDALAYDHVSGWHDWTVGGALYKLEAYNGWGYRRYGIHSPYLWSFSNQYSRGKFIADGVWDPNAVSGQCGGGTLWRRMVDLGLIRIDQ